VTDCGDVEGDVRNPDDIAQRATEAIEPLVRVGVVPLASLSAEHRFVITIDCDDWDPFIAPAVGWPEPGGLAYVQIATILRRFAAADRVAAVIFTEFQLAHDQKRPRLRRSPACS
jgi:arginase family enzyme